MDEYRHLCDPLRTAFPGAKLGERLDIQGKLCVEKAIQPSVKACFSLIEAVRDATGD